MADDIVEGRDYWILPKGLSSLHEAVTEYAVQVQMAAAEKQERQQSFPLAHGALYSIHWRTIRIHRAIRPLCELGWTPVTPILLRTQLDYLASCRAVTADHKQSEFMGFKYMAVSLIQFLKDPTITAEHRQENQTQIDKMLSGLSTDDEQKARKYIAEFTKPPMYWYQPEFNNPSAILSTSKSDLQYMYRAFSGAAHGGFMGSLLFDDEASPGSINPADHPRGTLSAIVGSSKLLLEMSRVRDIFEGLGFQDFYEAIKRDLLLPQQEIWNKMTAKGLEPMPDEAG